MSTEQHKISVTAAAGEAGIREVSPWEGVRAPR